MFEFWKNEWKLFLEDLGSIKNAFSKIFGKKQDYLLLQSAQEEASQNEPEAEIPVFIPDAIDHKVTAYFGENLDELRENMSGDKTQYDVLRNYAQYFKPYNESQEMCNSAFRKYYDRHALKIATEELPVEQARIVQNNVDLFIKGQEVFGENGQFIDSRLDSIFDKVGIDNVNKMVNILHDNTEEGVNTQGERLFAEVITYMVDNGIKVEKDKPLNEEEMKKILDIPSEMLKGNTLPCTACRYCTSHCPKGLDIPKILSMYNEHVFTGGGFLAPMLIQSLPEDKRPSACIGCKSCEAVCPQQIEISKAMKKFSELLEENK